MQQQENNVVDNLIQVINLLTPEQKKELSEKIRTTPEGINANMIFNFGVTNGLNEFHQKED